jgi:AAA15 family ATPase/GTPase
MAIDRVEIKDFLVFKGEFALDFCPGVNVIIGGNGTGKTTLLRKLYSENANCVFIPEKDILEHSKGLLTFIEKKQNGFGQIYRDVLINAMDSPTIEVSDTQRAILEKIYRIIDGEVRYDDGEGNFYTLKSNGDRVFFSNEASGYKKFGLLGLLVTSGQLEKGAVLLWDEPENSLNPGLMPVLVDILLELQRGGVQIFVATHSEILASYFAVNRQEGDSVMFHSLYKDGEHIKVNSNDRFDLLEPNKLTEESVKLYEKELDRGLGDA